MSVEVVSALPGRLRVFWPELVGNPRAAADLTQRVRAFPGVIYAQASTRTGRVLVLGEPDAIDRLAADWQRPASAIAEAGHRLYQRAQPQAHARVSTQARAAAARTQAHALAPQAALAGLLLAGLGLKHWVLGPSRWSRSWRSYDLAGVVTVLASYPFLRRGVTGLLARGRWNGDLVIGIAGLLALLIRENVLGLAVLFLHALAHERVRRALQRSGLHLGDRPHPLEQEYERRLAQWGNRALLAGLLAGVATRQPRRALATMIAAAPAGSALAVSLPMAEALSLVPAAKPQAAQIARQNQSFAQAMNTAGLILAGSGLMQPLGATVWYNCTALGVLLNSLRLLTPGTMRLCLPQEERVSRALPGRAALAQG